ncbi:MULTISPECIES: ABC transporter substrate-binding protein [Brucella/Ochrobactrum group]|uniref:ABC transporter substrate-binding protein n=1 Tax=Brucella/Ochrobactrum group TaxID=2826938 RepID=UPI001656363B|nr:MULTISPECIES: ABC transporter substrate-binding protein [Brucella/Ochrobactrum group]MBC8716901.1 ABC transporter substrate-binding protein [Ochrobactrum sp. Marseille-Q0166]
MKKSWLVGAAFTALAFASTAQAETNVSIGFSGWTGFGPLTLAKEAGIFKKNGLNVTLNKIPQASRHLALASGDIQCAATTVETWIIWNSAGVKSKQIFQMDKSYGADGIAVRGDVNSFADLKGKTVAASAPGTSPYFFLAYMLAKNGMTTKDVKIVNMEPGPAAQAFVAGQNDAAMTYEPYLSTVRAAPDKGKILATTLEYPAVMDTVGCTPDFLEKNPEAAKALATSYFEALEMIAADPAKSYEIMGKDVKQSGEEFGKSASHLRWQDKAANQKFFEGEFKEFSEEAAQLLLDAGVIKNKPNLDEIVDISFIK